MVYAKRDGEPFKPVSGRLPYDPSFARPLVVGLDGVARHLSSDGVIELRHRDGQVLTTTRAYERLDATLGDAALDTSEDPTRRGSFVAVEDQVRALSIEDWDDPYTPDARRSRT